MDAYYYLLSIIFKAYEIDSVDDRIINFSEITSDKEHLNRIFNNIYYRINEQKENNPDFYEKVVICLIKNYIKNNTDRNDIMISLLEKWSKDEAVFNFSAIEEIRKRLIIDFIKNILSSERKIIENYDNMSLLSKYDDSIKVDLLNDLIRNAINVVYKYCKSPEETYAFIEKAFYSEVTIDDVATKKAITFLRKYQGLVARLIYSDVYELLLIMKQDKDGVRRLKKYIDDQIKANYFSLNPSYGLENSIIFKCYFCLNDEQRKTNHQTVNDDQKDVLKGIYPLYMFEESGIIKKG